MFQIALEHDSLDVWVDDLQTLADLLDDKEVAAFLDAPQVPEARKLETIQQLLGDSVGTLPANLLRLLATKNMTLLVPGILEQSPQWLTATEASSGPTSRPPCRWTILNRRKYPGS